MGLIEERICESIEVKQKMMHCKEIVTSIKDASCLIVDSYRNGGKLLLCGNGGSASDALHIAGELVGRFQRERKPMAAIALNSDVASMTAIANDYGYEMIYARALEGYMVPGDVLIGLSTSGNSENVYRAMMKAKEMGGKTIAFLGKDGGKIKDIADIVLIVPSDVTARIQEAHIMIGHIICELVEGEL